MKGIVFLSDTFLLLVMLAVIVIMTVGILAIIQTHGVLGSQLPSSPRIVSVRMMFVPIKYETTLLAFLELEHQGIQMKKIFGAMMIQGKTTIWLEGKTINVKGVTETLLSQMIDRPYLFRIEEEEIVKSGSLYAVYAPSYVQKVTTKLFLLNGDDVNLELYVRRII